ncbi:MAG: hypothetical protein GX444_19155 [Myxococcales bacterium]|nr:hypothetical protein [Myxococcales bacterium]
MSEKKSLPERLKKNLTKRAMKYLSTPEGMKKFQQLLESKKRADRFLGAIYGLAGLPNLADKQQVEWAVDRQAKRLRDLSGQVEKVENLLKRLEGLLDEAPAKAPVPAPEPVVAPPPPPPVVEAPVVEAPVVERPVVKKPIDKPRVAKAPAKPKPAAKVPEKKAVAPKKTAKKAAPAKPKPKPAKRPKPLGAVPQKTLLSGSKSLLDLNFKKKK